MAKSIELKVAESYQNDVGRGLVRIDAKAREEMGVSTGDIVELKGKRNTAAVVWQAHPQDEGMTLIRMDGYMRQNTGVALGDKIIVKKAELKEAKKIILVPTVPIKYSPGFDQFVKKKLIGRALTKGDTIFVGVFGTQFPLVATTVQPLGVVMVNEGTDIVLKDEPVKEAGALPSISYEDVGGMKDTIKKIREMVELPLRHPEFFEKLGIEAPKGVLIYGPPGTGKTLLAKAVASESEANFIHIAGPELVSKFVGESEEKLRALFKEAQDNAPSIIFMDEIDAIAPKREEAQGEVERRMVSQLLTLLDGLKARGQVIVIGATNRPNSIDQALRRPGRFDREIELGVPDRDGRHEILQIHSRGMPLSEDVSLDELANITHGYTGADLTLLIKEAAMKTLRRILPDLDLSAQFIPPEILDSLRVTREDFFGALREIHPSALREVFIEKPNVKWADIGGLDKVKIGLKEAIELPLKNPEVFHRIGIRPIKGILLIGLPGVGKTMLAKAVATETEANFVTVKGSELMHKNVGESARLTRELFRKARGAAPCIIFIDEIDTVGRARSSDDPSVIHEDIVNGLLVEMDGLSNLKNIVVIAATNRPDILDPALLRAGRFDKIIEIPLPDEKTREAIFKVHTKNMPIAKEVNFADMAKKTEGSSGADIENICREAGMEAIRENVKADKVKLDNFAAAMKIIRPTVTKQSKDAMKKFERDAQGSMYG